MPPKQDDPRSRLERLKADRLRELCQKQAVESSGTKAVMINRLMACYISEPTTSCCISGSTGPSSKGKEREDECGVIVFTTTETATKPEMIEGAKRALEGVLEQEELSVNDDPLHVGNHRGLSLIHLPGEIASIKVRMAIVEAELGSTRDELASTREEAAVHLERTSFLETRIGDLTASLDAYKKIRHRFIDTYIKSKTPGMAAHTRKQIQEGNIAAHGGDAKSDADLYRDGKQRNDIKIFKELYGFYPAMVWTFSK